MLNSSSEDFPYPSYEKENFKCFFFINHAEFLISSVYIHVHMHLHVTKMWITEIYNSYSVTGIHG